MALPYFKATLEVNPNQEQYWLSYIDALFQTGESEMARSLLALGRQRGLRGEAVDALAERLVGPSSDEINALADLFNQERYPEGETLARRLTENFPQNGFCWKMLGAALNLQGRGMEALEPLLKAAELLPKDAEAHNDLGVTFKQLGRLADAEVSYCKALTIDPDFAEAHNNLGNALQEQGRLIDAEVSYRRALEIRPDSAETHSNLGNTLREQGQIGDAEVCCRRAVEIKPDFADAHSKLGNALQEQGRFADAEASYRRAIEIKPDFAVAYTNLGNTLREQDRLTEAEASHRRALEVKPDFAEAHGNLGVTLQEQGRLAEAEASYRRALAIRPDYPEAHNSMGVALNDLGRLDEAIVSFDRALAVKPEQTEFVWNRALAYLLKGDLRRGFKEYECRENLPEMKTWHFRQPVWDGSRIEGKTLLVHAEQGFGDAIQFARYLPFVTHASGAAIVLECQPELTSLFRSLKGVNRIVARGEPLPDFDFHIPLLSLPRIAGTTLETIPFAWPYLAAPPKAGFPVHKPEGTRLSVGIAWAGRPAHKRDRNRNRSMDFTHFLPLADFPGVTLYSIQKGERADDRLTVAGGDRVRDLREAIGDFGDSAGVLTQLDLVVTVDSAPAHLAGALGIPVWVLLPFTKDWRWLLDREESPWYPTMRLFRQSEPGDWDGVFERVRIALGELLEGRG